jgi:hypothetical protein
MNILIILNTLAIVYLLLTKQADLSISVRREETTWNKVLIGYRITLWKKTSEYSSRGIYSIYIPRRNKRKTELEEDVNRMINKYSHQGKLQSLSAMFSWLETWEQVRQFEKDYSVVDRKIVENLVANFKPRA